MSGFPIPEVLRADGGEDTDEDSDETGWRMPDALAEYHE